MTRRPSFPARIDFSQGQPAPARKAGVTAVEAARRAPAKPHALRPQGLGMDSAAVRARIDRLQADGYGHLPVCIAKTQYSFSTDPTARGAPSGHVLDIREVRLAAGAEFVVLVCGDVMTMPGLPKVPAAEHIDLDDEGRIVGLS